MKNRPLCSICLILFLLAGAGIHAGGRRLVKELRPSPLETTAYGGESICLTGRVYEKEMKDKYQILYLKDNSINIQRQSLKESRIIIYDELKTKVHIGQLVQAEGEVSFFEPARNPGNFDQKFYYQKQNIHARVWAERIIITDKRRNLFFDGLYEFRENWKAVLREQTDRDSMAVLSAVLLGEKGEMEPDLKELYQVNGIAHILAVSGLHLSFIGIGIYKMLRRLTGSYSVGGAFGILFLVLYILMIGLTVSAVRALVMFLFRVGADMAGRHYDAPTALSAAADIVLLWRPLCLYDGGFWLSFGAVLAILTVVPVVQEGMAARVFCKVSRKADIQSPQKSKKNCITPSAYSEGVRGHIWRRILQGLSAGIGINLVILPVLLYYFFEFPLYSFVLNLFVIPLMSLLLFLGMAGSLFALWFAPVSALLFWMCSRILWIYKMSCEISLGLSGARLVTGRPDMWQIAVYYGILFLGLIWLRYIILSVKMQDEQKEKGSQTDWRNRGKQRKQKEAQSGSSNSSVVSIDQNRKKKQIAVFFLWVVGIMILTTRFGETGKLTIVVLDVGQGDGIFMKGPQGNTYLVDGGSSDVKKLGQYRLEPFLKSQGVGRLDYVLISHGDSDHMNGVEEMIERQSIGVKIGTLVLPVKEVWDEALTGLAGKARNHGIRVVAIEPGQSIREGGMVITCIQPGNVEMEDDAGLEPGNAASMVLAVKYGEFDMLFTGDVEGEGEGQLTKTLEEQYEGCEWEVLKVAHHGSRNSSTEEFLRQIQPAYALISAGQENRYGHPHQETIRRLVDVGSKVYSTQENGAVIMKIKLGKTMKFEYLDNGL